MFLAVFVSSFIGAFYAPLQPFDSRDSVIVPNRTIEGIFTLENIFENFRSDTYLLRLSSQERDINVTIEKDDLILLKDIRVLIFFLSGEKMFWIGGTETIRVIPCKVLLDWRVP